MGGIEYLEVPGTAGVLRGMVHHGAGEEWVLLVHGYFSSNKIGPYRLYFELAEALAARGATVVRVDLSGMGESDGRIEDVRYADHVADYTRVRDELRTRVGAGLHVVAHCAGCHIPLTAVPTDDQRSLCLIAPFAPTRGGFEGRLFSTQEWGELQRTGTTTRKGWYCHRSFFDSAAVLQQSVPAELTAGTHVVFAGADELTPLADARAWADSSGLRWSQVPAADHNFTARSVREQLFRIVADPIVGPGAAAC